MGKTNSKSTQIRSRDGGFEVATAQLLLGGVVSLTSLPSPWILRAIGSFDTGTSQLAGLVIGHTSRDANMSQYTASVPSDGQVKPEIKEFFERFYQISDNPEAHEEYSNQFTNNGKLIMGPNESNGRSGECLSPSEANCRDSRAFRVYLRSRILT